MSERAAKERRRGHLIRLPVLDNVADPAPGRVAMGWTRDLSEKGT